MYMIFLYGLIIMDLCPSETCLVLSLIIWGLEIVVSRSWVSEFFLGCSCAHKLAASLSYF